MGRFTGVSGLTRAEVEVALKTVKALHNHPFLKVKATGDNNERHT